MKKIIKDIVKHLSESFSYSSLKHFLVLTSTALLILGCAATTATPTTPTSDSGNGIRTNPPSPPPPISIASFSTNGTTVYGTNFTITADAPNELVVSGTCEASEDGHTVEVLAQAISTNNIVATNVSKTTTCTDAGDSATWTTTFTRDNLNSLQTNNMRASFSASITNDAGLTGEASPRALFVQPNIAPRGNLNGFYNIVFEDVYQIGNTCRLVVAGNIDDPISVFFYGWVANVNNSDTPLISTTVVDRNDGNGLSPGNTPHSIENLGFSFNIQDRYTQLVNNGNPNVLILQVVYIDIVSTSNSYRFSVGVSTTFASSKTYHNCGVGPAPSSQ